VPVGPAWQRAQQALPALELYEDDGSHPTAAGTFLAACVFHHVLFGKPAAVDAVAIAMQLELPAARQLEAIAWDCAGAARP